MSSELYNLIINRKSSSFFANKDVDNNIVEMILKVCNSANDHGNLRAWEIRVFKNKSKQILLDSFVSDIKKRNGTQAEIEKVQNSINRAPLIFCVSTKIVKSKISKKDQIYAAAAICQLITLTSYVLGLASIWKTGNFSESEEVKTRLNISLDDEITGFIHIGYSEIVQDKTRKIANKEQVFFYD